MDEKMIQDIDIVEAVIYKACGYKEKNAWRRIKASRVELESRTDQCLADYPVEEKGEMATGKISVDHHFYKIEFDKAKIRIAELEGELAHYKDAFKVVEAEMLELKAKLADRVLWQKMNTETNDIISKAITESVAEWGFEYSGYEGWKGINCKGELYRRINHILTNGVEV